jgi:hypothetical protein
VIILLFSLALDESYAIFKISFARIPHALGKDMGPDIFHFLVFLCLRFKKKIDFPITIQKIHHWVFY